MPSKGDDAMWSLVMFDLPVKTSKQRTSATKFRNGLLDLGFSMEQLSVYIKYIRTSAEAIQIIKQIKTQLPSDGLVQIIHMTDHQWSNSVRFAAQEETDPEPEPPSFQFF